MSNEDVDSEEADIDSLVEDGEADNAPTPPWMDWWKAGPPWWFRYGYGITGGLNVAALAAIVMLQWGLWLIVTGNLSWPHGPWGMVVGVAIISAQLLALFENRSAKGGSCPLPSR